MPGQPTDLKTLFSRTSQQYQQRAIPIISVMLLSFGIIILAVSLFILIELLLFGPSVLNGSLDLTPEQTNTVRIIATILALPTLILCLWNLAAVMAIVQDENLSFTTALKKGSRYFLPVAWISLLFLSLVTMGMTLAILPGIILIVWFIFGIFIMFDEDKRGIDALLCSRELVRGYFLDTFLKLATISLVTLPVIGFSLLFPAAAQLVYYAYLPFLLLFLSVVYQDLKKVQGAAVQLPQHRAAWSNLGYISMIFPALFTLGFINIAISRLSPDYQVIPTTLNSSKIQVVCELLDDGNLPDCKQAKFVESNVSWQDSEGDVIQDGPGKWLDIRKVSIENNAGIMQMKVTINDLFSNYVISARENSAPQSPLLTLYIDSDFNKETGSDNLSQTGQKGYDLGMEIKLKPADNTETPQTLVSLSRLEGESSSPLSPPHSAQMPIEIAESELTIKIPHSFIGLGPGKLARLCYHESSQDSRKGISMDHYIAAD